MGDKFSKVLVLILGAKVPRQHRSHLDCHLPALHLYRLGEGVASNGTRVQSLSV